MTNLAKIRHEIDKIDEKILSLLKKRAEKCKETKKIKDQIKMATQDKKREEEILNRCETEYEKEIYQKILEQSRKIQT